MPGAGRPAAPARQRVAGSAEVAAAFERGAPVRCVVVPRGPCRPEVAALLDRAADAGVRVDHVGARKFERLRGNASRADVLALVGPDPKADLESVMHLGGAVWLLTGPAYPGNVGFAIRTAEVSGADGLYIDNDFDHTKRREARRASMRADRFMPIGWERADTVIAAARRAGKCVIGVEDTGTLPPWGANLAQSVLLIVGAEADGIPGVVLNSCDLVVRIPMAGFVASYNLQAAVAAIAAERFRQLEQEA
ncbi:MAG TPA: TrmH family RNA methyltransferase [Myxococcota bacterium]